MKKLLLLVLFFGVWLNVDAQNIVQYEYWYDSNYSGSNLVNTTPDTILDLNSSLTGTSGLTPGLHNVNFRAQDSDGKWSSAITEQFYNTGNWNIESYEYWFDEDYASKITTTVSPTQTYILTSNFNTSSAGYGLHALNLRVRDNAGKWSTTIREYFFKSIGGSQLSAAEYWIDSDFANRQPLAFTSSNSVFINQSVLTSNLDDQLHTFNFRMQDQGGKWSVVTSTYFMAQSQIVGYEYWFDTDFANKVTTSITPTQLLESQLPFDSRNLAVGDHVVYFRAKSNAGKYSTTLTQNFSVIITAPPVASNQELFGTPTVANLVATGTDLKWYISESSANPLTPNTVLSSGTYFVSQTIDSRESIRIPVEVTVTFIIPTALSFCKGAKVSDAVGTTTMKFYTALTKGSLLTGTAPLSSKTLYATQTINGLESSPRVPVLITVNSLPTAPSAVVLTSGVEVIKKVGNFIGTTTALTLTATPAGTVSTASYNWTLPDGVNLVSNNSAAASLSVNFNNVILGNTPLDFFVSSVSDAGCVSKTAKKLTVTRSEPAKPKALVLTDGLRLEVLKINKLGEYTGALNTRTLTLTATPETRAGLQASSYKWVLPQGVTTTATATAVANTYTSTLPTIDITLAGITNQATFLFQVFGVNGNGESLTSKDLTCTSAAPKTPGAITTPALTKPTYNTTCNNMVTVQVPEVLGATYDWNVSGGATISSGQGTNSIVINTTNASATLTISVTAANGSGPSMPRVLTIKKAVNCVKIASEDVVADEISVIAYPNPSSDVFTIASSAKGAIDVKVYDMQGRLVESTTSTQFGSKLVAGVYNVIVNQGANTKSVRVIKK